jgi:hypothetical protein
MLLSMGERTYSLGETPLGESKGMESVTGNTGSVDLGDWDEYFAKSSQVRYQVIATPGMDPTLLE